MYRSSATTFEKRWMKSSTDRLARNTTSGGLRSAATTGHVHATAIDAIAAAVLQSFPNISLLSGDASLYHARVRRRFIVRVHEDTVTGLCENGNLTDTGHHESVRIGHGAKRVRVIGTES